MALLHWNFKSKYLNANTDVNILLPDVPWGGDPASFYENTEAMKALWLLHGTSGDYTTWIRSSNIERYVAGRNVAVIMPSFQNADYLNWPTFAMGYNVYDCFLKELMPMVYSWLPVSRAREDNYIAGLSMGGRGVCSFAMTRPELFSGAAVFSAAPRNIRGGAKSPWPERDANQLQNAGGMDELLASPANTWDVLLKKLEKGDRMPEFYFLCAEEDPIAWQDFLTFREYAERINFQATFETVPQGGHSWTVWDPGIQKVIELWNL